MGNVGYIILCTAGVKSPIRLIELRDGDQFSCNTDVLIDQDILTFPYYVSKPSAVKILQPVIPDKNYFEFKIMSRGVRCSFSIGVVGPSHHLNSNPGWDREGVGYHSDDGKFYTEGASRKEGPTCTTGDIMGCGVDFKNEDSSGYIKVFFTKNGKKIGDFVKFKKPVGGLYPFIGMNSRGEQIKFMGCHRYNLPQNSTDKEGNL